MYVYIIQELGRQKLYLSFESYRKVVKKKMRNDHSTWQSPGSPQEWEYIAEFKVWEGKQVFVHRYKS